MLSQLLVCRTWSEQLLSQHRHQRLLEGIDLARHLRLGTAGLERQLEPDGGLSELVCAGAELHLADLHNPAIGQWHGLGAAPVMSRAIAALLRSAVAVAAGQDHERGALQPVDEAMLVIDPP